MALRYLILDVDGTLTDGGIYYDNTGNELKKFCTKDGTGLAAARAAGIRLVVLTGRECAATTRRMKELGVTDLYQGVGDKVSWITSWMEENRIGRDELGYIGDDINDLGPMKLCGFVGCPADAAREVRETANYVSPVAGGHGAARDVIEHILRESGDWNRIINHVFGAGV